MKLRMKFMLVSLLTGVALLAVALVGYLSVQKQALENIHSAMAAVAHSHAQQLDGWLMTKARSTEVTGGTIRQVVGNGEIPVAFLKNYKDDPDLMNLYVGLENGKFLDGEESTLPAGYDPRTRSWYQKAKEKGSVIFTDAYVDALTKKYIVSAAAPLKSPANVVTGVVGIDISLDILNKRIKDINLDGVGYGFIVDQSGIILAHPNQQLISQNLKDIPAFKDSSQSILAGASGSYAYEYEGQKKIMYYTRIPATQWTLAVTVPEEQAYKAVAGLKYQFGVLTTVSILLLLLAVWCISRSITKQVGTLTASAKQVAGGDLTLEQAAVNSKDEIGELSEAFNSMVGQLRGLVKQVGNTAELVAASAEELSASADQSAHAATQVAGTIAGVAAGTQRQVGAVDQARTVIEAMAVKMQQMVTNTDNAGRLAETATANAASGNEVVNRAVTQMSKVGESSLKVQDAVNELAASSDKIAEVVEVIANIAGQTNLLALNAAIEAARAGEQGRGFAVVAEEVRKLAEQSQEAARSITDMIRDNHESIANAVRITSEEAVDVKQGVELVNTAGNTFNDIARIVSQVTAQVKVISNSISMLSESSQQVSTSIHDITAVTQDASLQAQTVSAATEEQSASMQEIASSSQALANLAAELQSAIRRFRI
ncbi:MAG TPA: methyl-accepting chemotaxis protein [Selenomonadales bacterium]|nr:methyl-accepting chemotaxis protein [Selenomonadales bacterium]